MTTIQKNPHFEMNAPRVIAIGRTGKGKTTLLHYLAGKNLIAKPVARSRKFLLNVEEQDRLPGFNIGHTLSAGTGLPSSWYNQETNTVYWDCPGFGDPAGPEQEIINAFSIHQVFKSSAPTRVVLVVSESDGEVQGGRAKELLDFLKRVTDILPDGSLRGLSLVVTKQRDYEPHYLLQNILDDLSSNSNHEFSNGPVRKLLEALSQEGCSAGLPEPTAAGLYPVDQRTKILECIQSSQPLIRPTFNLSLSPEAKLLVESYAKTLNEKIGEFIQNAVGTAVIKNSHTQISNHSGNIGELRNKLKDINKHLDGFREALASLPHIEAGVFKEKLDSMFTSTYSSFFSIAPLRSMIEIMSFLRNIKGDISYETAQWTTVCATNMDKISKLTTLEREFSKEVVKIKGFLVGTSDLIPGDYSQAQLVALNTFMVDEDVERPGLTLNVVSPYWKVLGKKTINLSGSLGSAGKDGVGLGEDGQPGNPGGNGGNFYGKGKEFYGLENLTIQTDGGDGGKGGDGVKGKDGENGKDGNPSLRTSYSENNHYYHDRGTDGQAGSNGGRGGHGGMGGHKGYSIVEGYSGWSQISKDGSVGTHGKAGAGGKGGNHGRHCQGTFVTGRTKEELYEKTARITGRMNLEEYEVTLTIPGQEIEVSRETKSAYSDMPLMAKILLPHSILIAPFIDRREEIKTVKTPDQTITKTHYKTVDLPDIPAEIDYRPVPLPDEWTVPQGYQAARGSAPNGSSPTEFNKTGQQEPPVQAPLNKEAIMESYKGYLRQLAQSNSAEFIKNLDSLCS